MRVFSDEIGTRLVGEGNIERAATYAREQFESWGYTVELQDFHDARPEARVFARVRVEPGGQDLHSRVFLQSDTGSVSGTLVDAGAGSDSEFPATARGSIVLIQRGETLFSDMAASAVAHGAIGVLVANNKEGLFRGNLAVPADIPFVAVSQADGESLREQLLDGSVDVTIDVPESIDGTNVIARPASGVCRTISGGHYDTVPWANGAVDNASGAATVLELARAASAAGLKDHCFALWSAEEVGLLGSKHFVSHMTEAQRAALTAYFNFDVVAGGTEVDVIGDPDLSGQAIGLGSSTNSAFVQATVPAGASSDHASFATAGFRILMFTVDDLGVLHTEDDTFEFARQHTEALQPIADVAFRMLRAPLEPVTP